MFRSVLRTQVSATSAQDKQLKPDLINQIMSPLLLTLFPNNSRIRSSKNVLSVERPWVPSFDYKNYPKQIDLCHDHRHRTLPHSEDYVCRLAYLKCSLPQ